MATIDPSASPEAILANALGVGACHRFVGSDMLFRAAEVADPLQDNLDGRPQCTQKLVSAADKHEFVEPQTAIVPPRGTRAAARHLG
jgi:hypothetical protein